MVTMDVLRDDRLKPNEKLLFAEISSLTKYKGFCWASNRYFSELYKVDEKTVMRWITNLINCGHLERIYLYKKGTKEVERRILKICVKSHEVDDDLVNYLRELTNLGGDQKIPTIPQKDPIGGDQKIPTNNIEVLKEKNDIVRGEKNSPPTQPIPPNPVIPLFSEFEEMAAAGLPEKKERSVLFHNSDIALLVTPLGDGNFDYKEFEAKFEGPEFEKIDLVYYYHKVSDWSARKNRKATNAGWMAWVREFIRGDAEKGKVKLKVEHQADHNKFDVDSYLRYMDKNSEY